MFHILYLMLFVSNPTPYELFKIDILAKINLIRSKGCNCGGRKMKAVKPLTWDDALARSAAKHAIDMENQNYFNHISKNGRSIGDRAEEFGYDWYQISENIAFGQRTVNQVIDEWMASPEHCANIMDPDIKNMGVAKKGNYWVQDFGSKRN